jgi:hypothetical protein
MECNRGLSHDKESKGNTNQTEHRNTQCVCCAALKLWTGSFASWIKETHRIYLRPIAAEDSRGSLTIGKSEYVWMSLEKWRLKTGWILCRIDGQQCSTNCPEIKWGSTDVEDVMANTEILAAADRP